MTDGRCIGDSLREAINWAQDTLRTTRPIAEQTINAAIKAKRLVWQDGWILMEDDEELEKQKMEAMQTTAKSYNAAKRWKRLHFRNYKRKSSRNSQKSIMKQAATKFSAVANQMIYPVMPMFRSATLEESEEPDAVS